MHMDTYDSHVHPVRRNTNVLSHANKHVEIAVIESQQQENALIKQVIKIDQFNMYAHRAFLN